MDANRHDALKAALCDYDALPPEHRSGWFAELARRDPALAADVRSWIETPTRRDGRGVSGVVEAAIAEQTRAEPELPLPESIGPYRVVELIGAGGMGVVYRAEQQEPLRREVAIKLLRGGSAPQELLRRFEIERRALALMEHPGIARVLDAGIDERGTPFVVMELVRGEPITGYCRAHGLGARERASMFVDACRAVQHAHQKGVIHRDLKPSNIMVSETDARPEVKVIDFGVARLLGEEGAAAAGAGLTVQGQIIGTLGYMSPEQAQGRVQEIDTRTDVYALGAVFYELLTGSLPHDLEGCTPTDALRVVSASPPIPPRRRSGALRDLDADLEVVLLKALAVDPALRYAGPGTLADDVERWLRLEPVLAQSPSTLYQLRKLVQRHRVGVAVAAGVLVLVLAFGVAMSILYAGQKEALTRAQTEAQKATAINAFLQETIGASDPYLLGRTITVQEVVDRALPRLSHELDAQPEILAAVQTTLGITYRNLGAYSRADSLLRRALAVMRDLPGSRARETAAIQMELARNAFEWRHLAEADSIVREALSMSRSAWTDRSPQVAAGLVLLADIQDKLGLPAATESTLAEAIPLTRALHGEDSPELARALMVEGHLGWSLGDWPRSELGFGEAFRIFRKSFGLRHPETLGALYWWEHPRGALGLPPSEPVPSGLELVRLNEAVFGREHPQVAEAMLRLSGHYLNTQQFARAESIKTEAIGIVRRTMGDSAYLLNRAYTEMAALYEMRNDLATAEQWARRFLAVAEAIPNHATHPWRIVALEQLARVLDAQGRPADAEPLLGAAIAAMRRTTALGGIGGEFGGRLLCWRGSILFDLGHLDSTEVMMREALNVFRSLPDHPDVVLSTSALGICLASRGQIVEADSLLKETRALVVNEKVPVNRRRVVLARLVHYYDQRGRSTDAAACRAALNALPL